jgi:hypothetical protein
MAWRRVPRQAARLTSASSGGERARAARRWKLPPDSVDEVLAHLPTLARRRQCPTMQGTSPRPFLRGGRRTPRCGGSFRSGSHPAGPNALLEKLLRVWRSCKRSKNRRLTSRCLACNSVSSAKAICGTNYVTRYVSCKRPYCSLPNSLEPIANAAENSGRIAAVVVINQPVLDKPLHCCVRQRRGIAGRMTDHGLVRSAGLSSPRVIACSIAASGIATVIRRKPLRRRSRCCRTRSVLAHTRDAAMFSIAAVMCNAVQCGRIRGGLR